MAKNSENKQMVLFEAYLTVWLELAARAKKARGDIVTMIYDKPRPITKKQTIAIAKLNKALGR